MLNRLLAAGFKSAADVRALQPSELAAETGLSLRDAVAALQQLSGGGAQTRLPAQTALELLDEEERLPAVPSCVRALDEMLGTGVPMGKITEFCGAPGLGKTQLGIQLAVSVRTPSFLDGPSGHCIYIDTEGSFIPERVADIANSFVKHVHMCVEHRDLSAAERGELDALTVESVMSTIHYFRVHDYVEQIALVNVLHSRIQRELPRVKLVVIDSVAFLFRRNFEDYAMRTRVLGNMAQTLIELAKRHQLAVVLMNQVTTKLSGPGGTAQLVPALGETWGHASTNRVMLYEKHGVRFAKLLKSPNRRKTEVCYRITEDGVREEEGAEEEQGEAAAAMVAQPPVDDE